MKWTIILAATAIATVAAGASAIWIPALAVIGIAIDRTKSNPRRSR